MRFFISTLVFIVFLVFSNAAQASECTDYLSKIYTENYGKKVSIHPSSTYEERIQKFEGYVGKQFVSTIINGKGYMRTSMLKQKYVGYVCMFEKDGKIVWGEVLGND